MSKWVRREAELVRSYGYDAYGNRSRLIDYTKQSEAITTAATAAFTPNQAASAVTEYQTRYTYNAMNQLIHQEEPQSEREFHYDQRGNLTEEIENGIRTKAWQIVVIIIHWQVNFTMMDIWRILTELLQQMEVLCMDIETD